MFQCLGKQREPPPARRGLLFVRTQVHGMGLRPEARDVVGDFPNASVRGAGIKFVGGCSGLVG